MFFIEESKCPICGNIILKDEEFVNIPPLISNINDPIYPYSDSIIHKKCLNKFNLKNKLLFFKKEYLKTIPPIKAKNSIDGSFIEPYNMLFFNLLTSNENEDLFRFNFIMLDKSKIKQWQDREIFLYKIEDFLKAGKWVSATPSFNFLEYLKFQILAEL